MPRGADRETLLRLGQRMLDTMAHRGPDGQGLWVDEKAGLVLAHRRLAIQDPSDAAAQPMATADGDQVLVFNGEVYNHAEWRGQLARDGCGFGHRGADGRPARSPGDTEALLHALRHWGPDRSCRRTRGMFAWAWLERSQGRLTLARDRLGKKPLVVAEGPWGMAFASQLSALLTLPMVGRRLRPQALDHYLRWGHAPVDHTLVAGVSRVGPGEVQVWEAARRTARRRYWQAEVVATMGARQRLAPGPETTARLEAVLAAAVRDRLIADVPLGAFLSGGIDSALVVALMQEQGDGRTLTYSIGFDDPHCDESPQAAAIAKALGTRHTSWTATGSQARDLLSQLPQITDEPLGDASQLPTTLLALQASASVKVALTGDGGDEAFGGYPRYRQAMGLLGAVSRWPAPLRHLGGLAISQVRPARWQSMADRLPVSMRPTLMASKVDKLQRWLQADGPLQRRLALMQRWDPAGLRGGRSEGGAASGPEADALCGVECDAGLHESERMQLQEMCDTLSADLLAKMDRATMWASMEARSPLLDDRVLALAWRLDPRLKAEGPRSKEILRQLLARRLDPALFDRPKRGFSAPLTRWLGGELKEPVDELLHSLCRHTHGRWRTGAITAAWAAQQSGRSHEVDRLWTLVALEGWRRRWGLELP